MRQGWFKENGATIVSIISVLLSAFIVYSSNSNLIEKYEAEQRIERQKVAVDYYKWWQVEFQKNVAAFLTALDIFRDANTRIKVIVIEDPHNRPEIIKVNKDIDSAKWALKQSYYQLVCMLDNENDSHRNLLFSFVKMYNNVLDEAVCAMKGEDYERNGDLETVYFNLINAVRDDSFRRLDLISKFNKLLVPPVLTPTPKKD